VQNAEILILQGFWAITYLEALQQKTKFIVQNLEKTTKLLTFAL